MNPLKAFDIQFVGLKVGEHIYKFEIDYKFFEYFQYDDLIMLASLLMST